MIVRLKAVLLLASAALPAALGAQRNFPGGGRNNYVAPAPVVDAKPYNGLFTFARLSYTVGQGGYYYRGLPAWAHGYNEAELNLLQILNSLSVAHPRLDAGKVLNLDDPELFKYPVAYMSEAGYWVMSDKEALAFRKYLLKGGFVIFDDFRPPPRGGGGWVNFEDNMKRVLPGVKFLEMDPKNPLFHSFYELNSFSVVSNAYDQGRPEFYGIFVDNDPTKRLMAIVNFNTDISDYWEFSGQGRYAVGAANEGYKLGINYIIYPLTH